MVLMNFLPSATTLHRIPYISCSISSSQVVNLGFQKFHLRCDLSRIPQVLLLLSRVSVDWAVDLRLLTAVEPSHKHSTIAARDPLAGWVRGPEWRSLGFYA